MKTKQQHLEDLKALSGKIKDAREGKLGDQECIDLIEDVQGKLRELRKEIQISQPGKYEYLMEEFTYQKMQREKLLAKKRKSN